MNLTISFTKLDKSELLSLAKSVDVNVKTLPGIESVYNPFSQALNKCITASTESIEKTMAKEESLLVKNEDAKRDNLSIGLLKFVEAQMYNPDAVIANAAAELNQVLAKIGNRFYRLSYDKQSVVTETALGELENAYSAHVQTIGLDGFVSALRASQNIFAELRQKQIGVFANDNDIISFTEVRNDLENALRALFAVLPALYVLNPTNEFKTAITVINETISKIR